MLEMVSLSPDNQSTLADQPNSPDYARNCKDLLHRLTPADQASGIARFPANNTETVQNSGLSQANSRPVDHE